MRCSSSAAGAGGAVVCRYGGEEFAILLPNTDRRSAAQVAENIRRAIADSPVITRFAGPASSVAVTISVGVAVCEPGAASHLTTPERIVQAADKSLYAAKGAGRNCVRIFSERSSGAIAA